MQQPFLFLSDLDCSERIALWSIRTLLRSSLSYCQTAPKRGYSLFPECCWKTLDVVETAMQDGIRFLHGKDLAAPRTGIAGAQEILSAEQRFLWAIERAQNEHQQLVRVILKTEFHEPYVQSRFSLALILLADCLAGIGHWLPSRYGTGRNPELRSLTAPCLPSVMRWQTSRDASFRNSVMWPQIRR